MTNVVDFGCGYGTFTIPAAGIVERGVVHAFDIDEDMIDATRNKALQFNLSNVWLRQRDFASSLSGIAGVADSVSVKNICGQNMV